MEKKRLEKGFTKSVDSIGGMLQLTKPKETPGEK